MSAGISVGKHVALPPRPRPQTLAAASAAERVHHVVPPDQRQLKTRAPRGRDEIERRAFQPALFDRSRREIPRAGTRPERNHAPARNLRETRHALVIRIEHRGRIAATANSRSTRARPAQFRPPRRKNSRCSTATRVTTPTSGDAICASAQVPRDATFPVPPPPRHAHHPAAAASAAGRIRCSNFPASSARGTARPAAPPEFLSWWFCRPSRHGADAAGPASPSARFRRRARQSLQRGERVVDGEEPGPGFPADILRNASRATTRPPRRRQCRGNKSVSIVTRTVYGDEQFSRLDSARINRDTGQPGHGVEPAGAADTQRVSHLYNRPPHRVSNGLGLSLNPSLSDLSASLLRLQVHGRLELRHSESARFAVTIVSSSPSAARSLAPFRGRQIRSCRRAAPATSRGLFRQQHDVAGCGFVERHFDGPLAVRFDAILRVDFLQSHHHVVDDPQRVFAARIVAGQHDKSLSDPAASPISGRLVRSRSPPAPNKVMMRPPGLSSRAVEIRLRNASSVCA